MIILNSKTMNKKLFLFFILLFSISFTKINGTNSDSTIIYRIPIFDEINSTTWLYIQRGFEEAEKLDANSIIIHLNTYGGEVVFADSIRTKILNSDTPVYVFIDNNAASAGALISIACKKIFMRKGANIGAATVVNQTGDEMPDKYQSYMRSTIRATAEAHGRDTIISQNDTIVKWIRDPKIAEAMVDERVVIKGLVDSTQVLTFTTLEAIEYGYCDGIAANIDEVAEQLNYTSYKIVSYKPTVFDNVKGFLNNTMFRAILILIIIGGIYFELQTPGVGFPILAAIFAAVLYFAPLYIDGLAAYWEIIIFIIGVALLLVEIFIIPGFGITGVSGIILIITGLTLSMVDNVVFNFDNVPSNELLTALLTVFLGVGGGLFSVIYLSSKILKSKKGAFSHIALNTTQEVYEGYISVDSTLSDLVGLKGVASTDLRPSGKIIIDNEVYDARANEGFIEKKTIIKVVSYSSGQLNVRKDY